MEGKKFYKSETNKKISGVCGGVADYFGVDATIVRVIWFVVTWFYGIGLIVYIAAALILPTESEAKSQMARDVHFDVRDTPEPAVQPVEPAEAAPAEPAEATESPAADSTVVEFNIDETAE